MVTMIAVQKLTDITIVIIPAKRNVISRTPNLIVYGIKSINMVDYLLNTSI